MHTPLYTPLNFTTVQLNYVSSGPQTLHTATNFTSQCQRSRKMTSKSNRSGVHISTKLYLFLKVVFQFLLRQTHIHRMNREDYKHCFATLLACRVLKKWDPSQHCPFTTLWLDSLFPGPLPTVGLWTLQLWSENSNSSIIWYYVPSFCTGAKLYCLLTEAGKCEQLSKGLTFHSTHNRSFQSPIFPGNWLHWYWQPKWNKDEIHKTHSKT